VDLSVNGSLGISREYDVVSALNLNGEFSLGFKNVPVVTSQVNNQLAMLDPNVFESRISVHRSTSLLFEREYEGNTR